MLEKGQQIGRYKILSAIGAGGMGEVFLATDSELGRSVGLKVLPSQFCSDAERVNRFKQEAKAASSLNHPNIITIHEIGEVDGRLFLATEFIEGETLRDKIKKNDLSVYESVRIAEQIAAGLSAAHQAHIIHRDIKPENIMIRSDGYVKVLDFGLAKLVEKKNSAEVDAEAETRAQVKTKAGMIMGTARYMSPEQARGKETDERTDVWSLGVCLYEMLSGRQPFEGETTSDTIASILTKEFALLDENLPPELHRIVRKTLQKDADKRYQTAKDLLIDLEEVKEELKFQNKLERSAAPHRKETKTQILSATTTGVAPTTSSAEYIAAGGGGGIKQHKRGLGVGMAILLIAVAAGLGYWFLPANRPANTKQIESIAVMPFVNQSGNADTEYLSDGITETLIASLSRIPKLNVKARSSVFRYKGKETDLKTIGRELSVQAILNGNVAQRGEQLFLNVELVDAQTENVLWSASYNRKQTDLVSLQNEIAREVSTKLKAKLSGADEQRLTKSYTENAEAYQLYLKGRFFWNKFTPADHQKAFGYFNQAIAQDPGYALAYVGLADTYGASSTNGWIPPKEGYLKAKAAARKALEIDDTIAEAHSSMGALAMFADFDWEASEREYKRAIELNPNYELTYEVYSYLLSAHGRHDEAIAKIKQGLELDPLSANLSNDAAGAYYLARQYDEAIKQFQKTLEIEPNRYSIHAGLGNIYEMKDMYEEAIAKYQTALSLSERTSINLAYLGHAYGASGRRNEAVKILKEMTEQKPVSPYYLALLYTGLGDKDKAIEQLNKAYEERDGWLIFLKVEPLFDPLRDDLRFQELLRKVGFP